MDEVYGSLGGKVPVADNFQSSHGQKFYPPTSHDKVYRDLEYQIDRNFYVDWRKNYFALKLKLVKCRDDEIYQTGEARKEHKAETKTAKGTKEEAPVPFVTNVNNILHSRSSNAEVYINYQRLYKSNVRYAHKS